MAYEAKNYDHLLGLQGFSDVLLKNHFTLYQGYVTHTNKAYDLMTKHLSEDNNYEYGEIKRRFGWEYNGMRLHEYYFENLSKETTQLNQNEQLYKQILKDFGSYENFEKDFKSTGAMRGIGWVILYFDKQASRLFNVWINEHDMGHLGGNEPLLVMDVFEHAYITDYGIKKADYIETFMKSINFKAIEQRFNK